MAVQGNRNEIAKNEWGSKPRKLYARIERRQNDLIETQSQENELAGQLSKVKSAETSKRKRRLTKEQRAKRDADRHLTLLIAYGPYWAAACECKICKEQYPDAALEVARRRTKSRSWWPSVSFLREFYVKKK